MIAVTVGVGDRFRRMANVAADSCAAATGLDTVVLDERIFERSGMDNPQCLRLRIFDLFPKVASFLYFDADLLFLRPIDVRRVFFGSDFLCVKDVAEASWIQQDAKRIGIPAAEYFNSGIIVANRTKHLPMMRLAESLLSVYDGAFADQGVLNWACKLLGVKVQFLPRSFNDIGFNLIGYGDVPHVGHFAGERFDDMSGEQVEVFLRTVLKAYAQFDV